jgi:hypothetical protein
VKRYWISAGVIVVFVLVTFLLVEAMQVGLLVDPTEQMGKSRIWAASIGGGLLVADVFIPVPSSVIMIAHGAILGLWPGFLVSFLASIAGAMLGWGLGRRCEGWVMRTVPLKERERAERMFAHYGVLTIVIPRSGKYRPLKWCVWMSIIGELTRSASDGESFKNSSDANIELVRNTIKEVRNRKDFIFEEIGGSLHLTCFWISSTRNWNFCRDMMGELTTSWPRCCNSAWGAHVHSAFMGIVHFFVLYPMTISRFFGGCST